MVQGGNYATLETYVGAKECPMGKVFLSSLIKHFPVIPQKVPHKQKMFQRVPKVRVEPFDLRNNTEMVN